jgi:DNA-binding beta-propeller fold protein YncE
MSFGLLALGALLFCSCQTQPWRGFPHQATPPVVWPAPPEPARVAFVMQIRRHQDLFGEAGAWNAIGRLFAGERDSTMVRPFALALHPAGGLLVTDPGARCVHYYDWGRRRYLRIGAKIDGGLPSPVGVAALPDGRILVSDSRLGRIEVFDGQGERLGTFGPENTIARPAGLAVDAARGRVYVADVTAHCVAVLDLTGRLTHRIGSRGGGDGEFNFPTHLALDAQGNLAVTDSMNFRAQVFGPDGAWLRGIGKLGDAPGQFSKPKGIVIDPLGNTIVVEGLYDTLQFFSPRGELLLSLGGPGTAPGEFWLPAGACLDPAQGLLFVADSYNRRVHVFRLLEGSHP